MGININIIPDDFNVQSDDFLVGSDKRTGKTYSYPIQNIIDLISASSTSIVGINVQTIVETPTQNFVQVINADTSGTITFNTGDVGIFDVYGSDSQWKSSYILIKNSSVSITYGNSQSQLAMEDLVPIRIEEEMSLPTSGVNVDGISSTSVVSSNDGDNYTINFKGFVDGNKTEIKQVGNNLQVNLTDDAGQNNTLVDAETIQGNVKLAGVKAGNVLKVKTLKVSGAVVTDHGEYVDVNITSKSGMSSSFELAPSDSGSEIWMKNSAAVTITIPANLPSTFDVGILQAGSGQVRFVAGTGATLLGKNTITGVGGSVLVTTDPDTPTSVFVIGDLITT